MCKERGSRCSTAEKEVPRRDSHPHGGGHSEVDRMTKRGCRNGDKNSRSKEKQPRLLTDSDVRADNEASVKTSELLTDVSPWIGCIRSELGHGNPAHHGCL